MNAATEASALAGNVSLQSSRAAGRSWEGFHLGKYREIVIAVAMFLVLDLGVLVLNFYNSFRIAEDAVSVNLSGRQRMLSQRTAKALYAAEASVLRGAEPRAELEELASAVRLFDATLRAFQVGGSVTGGAGQPVVLRAAESEAAKQALAKAVEIWTPYLVLLDPLLKANPQPQDIEKAASFARANNLRLLALMNDLTTALESAASQRASLVRSAQVAGIVLALLNFAFILFKFIRRLRQSDAAIESANEENRRILRTVREGLFLLGPDLRLGTQMSDSVSKLIGMPLKPGQDLLSVLQPLVKESVWSSARDYVRLLFAPHVKEELVRSINPLSEVELEVRDRLGETKRRHLSFEFNRVVLETGQIQLLVTVQDITEKVELGQRLTAERERAQREMSMMLQAGQADAAALRQFIERSEAALLHVNDLLRGASSERNQRALTQRIDQIFRSVHTIKGNASALGLELFADLAHRFEAALQTLRDSGGCSGSDLLALPIPLEDMLAMISALRAIAKMQAPAEESGLTSQFLNQQLTQLAQTVARDTGRRVSVKVEIAVDPADLGTVSSRLHDVAVQLVRNAVVHGIEPPASRQAVNKSPTGQIDVRLARQGEQFILTVRDDGRGLSVDRVRQRLRDLGWYTEEQLSQFDGRQILSHLFRPGFTTADDAGPHAGRGIGLDIVQSEITRLGGRLAIATQPGLFTEFRVSVPM